MNTKFKISFWNSAFFFLMMVSLLSYLYIYLRADLYRDAVNFLIHEAGELGPILAERSGEPDIEEILAGELDEGPQFDISFAVFDASCGLHYGESSPLFRRACGLLEKELQKNPSADKLIFRLWEGSETLWVVAVPAALPGHGPGWVFLSSTLSYVKDGLFSYKLKILWTLPVLFFISLVVGWILAGIALAPVKGLTKHMEAISVTSLNERVYVKGTGDELDRLAATFNHLMQRIDDAYGRVSQFTSDAAHELKTPITIIKNEMEVALTRNRTEREYRKLLESSLEEMERLTVLMDKMLMLARTDSRAAAKENVALKKLLEDVKDFFEPACEPRSITIEIDAARETVLSGDGDLLRQLFYNLLDNAVRYNRDGGKIVIILKEEAGNAVVTVKDTGPGIPPEHQGKIFDRFYRVDASRSSAVPGHGLGLAICLAAARAHGGNLTLRSFPGKGSEFTVFLPLPVLGQN